MTWWLAWLIFVASFVLLGFVGYRFSVRALRFFTLFFAVIVIGLVTRYGVTHRMGGPASFVNSFIRGFNDLSVAFFQLPFGRDVQAPGRIGWLAIIVALVFAYRELEVWAMRWQPPTVDTSALVGDQQMTPPGDTPDGQAQPDQGAADSQRHARLMAELRFRLPAVEVRAPAILPGGTKPSELASIVENSGVSGSGLAGAIVNFFQMLWPNPRRYQVRVWIEQDGRSASATGQASGKGQAAGDTRVTVDIENVRTGASVATKTLVAHDCDEAASLVAGYVGRHVFKEDPTAPPWCVGSYDGSDLAGLLLAAQQRVFPRSPQEVASCRDAQIGILERCRLDAGVARYELAQLYDLQGYHVKALWLHAINRRDYPRFYRGRYRLGMSLEMVANPAFRPRLGEAAYLRESLRVLDLCRVTENAEETYEQFLRGELPDPPGEWLPFGLQGKLLIAAGKELDTVRRQLALVPGIWGMFWHRDEGAIRKQYWRLAQRERFRDGVRVAGLLVDLRRSLLEEDRSGSTRPDIKGRQARIAMNIVAAVTDRGAARAILHPAAALPASGPLPRRNAKKTRWLPGQRRTPSWQAAYNAACLFAALAHGSGYGCEERRKIVARVVTSLRRAVNDPECEMERPWDWISTDPDFRELGARSQDFADFLDDQKRADYPADSKACIFCGSVEAVITITVRHVFPGWTGDLPTPAAGQPDIGCVRSDAQRPQAAAPAAWPAVQAAGHPLRGVCEPCEAGWMARLESAVLPLLLPMIEGFRVELSAEEQVAVARWAVLKAAVLEHIWAHDPVLTAADREIIRTRNLPPAGVQVRLARAEQGGALRAHGLVFEPRRHDEKAISVLITLGCLVAEVTGGPGTGTRPPRTAGAPGTGSITIFPPQPGTVPWPPPATLDVDRLLPEVTPWLPGTADHPGPLLGPVRKKMLTAGPACRGNSPPSERHRARGPACASTASGAGLRRG